MKTVTGILLDKISKIETNTYDQQQIIDYIKSLIESTYYDEIPLSLIEMEHANMSACYKAGAMKFASNALPEEVEDLINESAINFLNQNIHDENKH